MNATNEEFFELNEAQKISIDISRAQITDGEFETNEKVMRGLREWLLRR